MNLEVLPEIIPILHHDIFEVLSLFVDRPGPPGNLQRKAASTTSITIQWNVPRDLGNLKLLYYSVEIKTANTEYAVVNKIYSDKMVLEHTFNGLQGCVLYDIRVRAYNRMGGGEHAKIQSTVLIGEYMILEYLTHIPWLSISILRTIIYFEKFIKRSYSKSSDLLLQIDI